MKRKIVFAAALLLLCNRFLPAQAAESSLIQNEVYTDDFEIEGTIFQKGITAKLNENWQGFANGMGYDGAAKYGINNKISNFSSSLAVMDGKFLYVEARVEDLRYGMIPTVLYTGAYPDAPGYDFGVDVKTGSGNRGTGVRFMISPDQRDYYELYFPGDEYNSEFVTVVLNKITDGERQTVYIEKGTSKSDCIQGGVIYRLQVQTAGGKIHYSIAPRDGADGFSRENTVADANMPFTTGKLGFIASGGSGKYAMFDNFSIAGYDPYIAEQAEPETVFYREVSYGKTPQNQVYDLETPYRIRKITAQNGTEVFVSQDNDAFISLGAVENGTLINTITNLKYRYVKLSNPADAKIYTDTEPAEYLTLYTAAAVQARIGGALAETYTSAQPAALTANGATLQANALYNKNIVLTAQAGEKQIQQIFRIAPPVSVKITGETLLGTICLAGDAEIKEPTAVVRCFDAAGTLLSTQYVPAVQNGNQFTFTADYAVNAEKVSVFLKNGAVSLTALTEEYTLQ